MTIDPRDGVVVATNISQASRGGQVAPGLSREPLSEPPRTGWLVRALLLLVPGAVALVMVSVLVGERARIDVELQLQTVSQARPGATLPVRAFFYQDLQAIEGPRLADAHATAELLDAARQVLLSKSMTRGVGNTLETTLPLPPSRRGPLTVRVTVHEDQSTVSVERGCVVSDAAPTLNASPRPLRPLQQFAPGPVRREGDGAVPAALDAQIIGGACAPEFPCEVLVHVGEPAAVISVAAYAALDLLKPPPSNATTDVVRFTVRVHGPESELRIAASIDGVVVARRSFRLAVAQAMLPLETSSIVDASRPLGFTREGSTGACIVDLFHDERWVHTASFDRCDHPKVFTQLASGMWRVQVRDDAFGGDLVAVRTVYALAPSENRSVVLATLAQHVIAAQPDNLLARRIAEHAAGFVERDFAGYSAWLLASLEDGLIRLPDSVSSYPTSLNELAEKRSRLRMYCLVALLLSAIVAVSLIARRGLHASARARDIMEDAGDPEAHSRARRTRMTLTVIASAASIAVAFVAIALYVLARG
jgi:hypothetical protein